MNSIWNNNYKAFTSRFPNLASLLPPPNEEEVCNPPFWEISETRNGMITCSESSLRLHSAYNPEREAVAGITNPEIMEKSTTVFYGFGLGYHVIQWVKMMKEKGPSSKKLVLIEPDPLHFYSALSFLDWTDVFTYENLILAINCPAEGVLPLLEDTSRINVGNTGVSDAFFFTIPAFIEHAKPYFDTVQAIVTRNKRKNEINAATLKKFGRLWCKNSLKNIDKLRSLSSVSSYIKEDIDLSDIPFFIVGAGPSLQTMLPYLKEIKKRCIVICVETALRALLRNGVEPDFIVITDPQWWAYKHIAGLKAPNSILITEISTYSSVFRFNCNRILLCDSQFPIGQYFQSRLGVELGDLGTGGSVASSCWNLAHLWGAKEIYTIGLDFAFPENKTHIKGSDAEETILATHNRLITPDKATSSSLYNANASLSKNYKGEDVVTDSRMKMFAWWFESRLAGCPETKTYTLSLEGLYVPGIEVSNIDTILSYKDISDKKESFFNTDAKPIVNGDKVPLFKKLLKEFPNEDFLNLYGFLKEYL